MNSATKSIVCFSSKLVHISKILWYDSLSLLQVAHAEGAGYIAALVHNVGSDKLVPMAAGKSK